MIQLKSASDKAIYERYKNGHDGSMGSYIKWYERGRKKKNTDSKIHDMARGIVVELRNNHTYKEMEAKLDVYPTILVRILNKRYDKVPYRWAHKIAQTKYDLPDLKEVKVTEDDEKIALELLKENNARENVKEFCRRYDLGYVQVIKTLSGEYKNPQPICLEIIKKLK